MEDLRETTHYRHYELYRQRKLQEMGFSDDESMRFVVENLSTADYTRQKFSVYKIV